ncbi:hypothetical protein SprV_0802533200 [Sparganum proliferum]
MPHSQTGRLTLSAIEPDPASDLLTFVWHVSKVGEVGEDAVMVLVVVVNGGGYGGGDDDGGGVGGDDGGGGVGGGGGGGA